MDKKEREDFANFTVLQAYSAAASRDGEEDMIEFEMLDEIQQEILIKLQRNVCNELDVKPEDFSVHGTNDIFIYS
jgi:hypothetical protein